METRIFRSKIWTDPIFCEQTQEFRLLVLYLLTNQYLGLLPVVQLSDRQICFDCGISKGFLESSKKPLEYFGVYFIDGWVCYTEKFFIPTRCGGSKVDAKINRQINELPDSIKKVLPSIEYLHNILVSEISDTSIHTSMDTLPKVKSKKYKLKSKKYKAESINNKLEIKNNKTEIINQKEEIKNKEEKVVSGWGLTPTERLMLRNEKLRAKKEKEKDKPLYRVPEVEVELPAGYNLKPIESSQLVPTTPEIDNKSITEKVIDTPQLVTTQLLTSPQLAPNQLLTSSEPVEKSYGNNSITSLIGYFEEKAGFKLDGTVKSNRHACYNLVRKLKKNYPERDAELGVRLLIDAGLADDFHKKNLTNFSYLYRNIEKIANSYRLAKSQNVIENKVAFI